MAYGVVEIACLLSCSGDASLSMYVFFYGGVS